MRPGDHFYESRVLSTKEDAELFAYWTGFLPKRTPEMPYHSGPSTLHRLELVTRLLQPATVVEIGFNLGHSAVMFLELGAKHVTSIEISEHPKVLEAAMRVGEKYGNERFSFHQDRKFIPCPDLLFIDGSHEQADVEADIDFGLRLGVERFLLDDYDLHHGPGVIAAVKSRGLIPLALFGQLAYCVPSDGYEKFV